MQLIFLTPSPHPPPRPPVPPSPTVTSSPLPTTFSTSLSARQDFSPIYTGDLCLPPTPHLAGKRLLLLLLHLRRRAGSKTVALYAFRNTCGLMGYNPGILMNEYAIRVR